MAPQLDWSQGLPLKAGPHLLGLYQPSPETAAFWDAVNQQKLVVRYCKACDWHFHPRRLSCTSCGNQDLTWKGCSGKGVVHSFSEIWRAPSDEFRDLVPYTVGVVTLDVEVNLFSRILDPCHIGMPVSVDFERRGDGTYLPVFRSADGQGA